MITIPAPPQPLSIFGKQQGMAPIPGDLCFLIQPDYKSKLIIGSANTSAQAKRWLIGVSLGFTGPGPYTDQQILLANRLTGSSSKIVSTMPGSIYVLSESVFIHWRKRLRSPDTASAIRDFVSTLRDPEDYIEVIRMVSAFKKKYAKALQGPMAKISEEEEYFFVPGKYLKPDGVARAQLNYRRALQIAELQDRE